MTAFINGSSGKDNSIATENTTLLTATSESKDNLEPKSHPTKRSLVRLTVSFASGQTVGSVILMVAGILVTRFTEPEVLGLFRSISLVLGYIPFVGLGILTGLNRELPFYVGQGNQQRAHELASGGQAWALILGLFIAIIFAGIAIWECIIGQWQFAAGWGSIAILVFLLFISECYLFLFKTHDEFEKLAIISVIKSSVNLLFVLPVWLFGFYGLCIRAVSTSLTNFIFLWRWKPLKVRPRWNTKNIFHLLKIGAPIFWVAYIYNWWEVLNLTLILKYMGVEGIGLYAITSLAGVTIAALPAALGSIIYPRMARKYGETNSLADLIRYVRRPTIILTLCMIPIISVAWWLIPPVVEFLVPMYVDGIEAAQWSLLYAIIMSLGAVNNVYAVVKRQHLYGIAIVLGMLGYLVCLLLLIRSGPYLAAFPKAMVVGRLIFMLFSYIFITYLWFKEKAKNHELIKLKR